RARSPGQRNAAGERDPDPRHEPDRRSQAGALLRGKADASNSSQCSPKRPRPGEIIKYLYGDDKTKFDSRVTQRLRCAAYLSNPQAAAPNRKASHAMESQKSRSVRVMKKSRSNVATAHAGRGDLL